MPNRSQDWLAQAGRDLEKAKLDLDHAYYEWSCFTAQQSAEKAVKALVYHLNGDPWGHSVTGLLKLLKDKVPIPEIIIEYAQLLDAYYTSSRYPNGWYEGKPADYFNEKKAREAYDATGTILQFVRDTLS